MARDKEWWRSLKSALVPLVEADAKRSVGVLSEIEASTVPLYSPKNLVGVPEVIATGVLLAIRECVFLLTAAHAIEQFNGYPVLLTIDDRFVPAYGESYRTKLPQSGTHVHDPLDAAVLRIDGDARDKLLPACLALEDLHPTFRPYDIRYCVAGYPRRTTRREGRALIHDLQAMALAGQPIGAYEKLGLSPTLYIVMEFGKRLITRHGFAKAPSIRGMSGGGVWIVPALQNSPLRRKLAGIFIETRKNRSVAVGTSISVHLSLILAYHPELEETIKKAEASHEFEEWLMQKGDARSPSKDRIPPEFRSFF